MINGGRFVKGHKLSQETKDRMSASRTGEKHPMYGRRHTPEAREKMRLSKLGKKLSPQHVEKISIAMKIRGIPEKCQEAAKARGYKNKSMLGKKHSIETRIKIGLKHKGEKCYFWKGGVTKENDKERKGLKFRLWREAVFKRDNWTCQDCGQRGGKLHPHHIKPFSEFINLRYDINNGQTLCRECHKKTDNYGGKKRNNMLGNNFCGDMEYGGQDLDTIGAPINNVQEEVFIFEPGKLPGGDRGASF